MDPKNSLSSYDVLTVGCGPVGLAQTIHLDLSARLQGRDLQFIMLDKRESYVRGHSVRLDKKAVKSLSIKVDNIANQALASLVQEYNEIIKALRGNHPIADIETKLFDFAKEKLEIQIFKGKDFGVSDEKGVDDFIDKYKPQIVITAGGAHCIATKQVFGEHHRTGEKPLGNLLQMKCKRTKRKENPKVIAYGNAFKRGRYVATPIQSRHFDEEGKAKTQVFLSITNEEVKALRALKGEKNEGATFRHPLTVQEITESKDPRLDSLKKSVESGLSMIQSDKKDQEAIVAISLSGYRSHAYGKLHSTSENEHEVAVFKAGDAAGGVPYQRSLCGSCLVVPKCTKAALSVLANEKKLEKTKALDQFNKEADSIWKKEIFWANLKYKYVKISDTIHWHTLKVVQFARKSFVALWNWDFSCPTTV